MTAFIFYSYYLSPDGSKMTIGGVQTYITNLAELLIEIGYEVVVYQLADKDFTTMAGKIRVEGVKGKSDRGYVIGQRLFDKCRQSAEPSTDIIIFGTDTLNVPCPGFKTISIQHGIYWDIPQKGKLSKFAYFREYLKKAFKAWKEVKRVACVDSLVCVDYNFINWYRSLVAYPQVNLNAIMNYSGIPDDGVLKKPNGSINIIFARRLVPYRGTRLFTESISRLLEDYSNLFVTVAGNGPDETYMKKKLNKYEGRVKFITYSSDESLSIHADKHIAVVPTTGSEGTSLSLLEAMACGCAVVCTNVGGMTNIVQNGYNGLMIDPSSNSLYDALKLLIEDNEKRKLIGIHARETVKCSFSKNRWREDWKKIISSIEKP